MKTSANIVKGLMCITLLGAVAASAVSQRQIHVEVDQVRVDFDGTQPQIVNGRVMVPLRGVFEKLGAQADWTAYNETVTVTKADTDIVLKIGDDHAAVNGRHVYFDAPAINEKGRTLVPVRFLSETLGANVYWNSSVSTVEIGSAIVKPTVPPREMPPVMAYISAGTVVPFLLETALSSNNSKAGDRFVATIDTRGKSDYLGLATGTKIEGHVDLATPRQGTNPGVLGLAFDRIVLTDGRKVPVFAQVIGLD